MSHGEVYQCEPYFTDGKQMVQSFCFSLGIYLWLTQDRKQEEDLANPIY